MYKRAFIESVPVSADLITVQAEADPPRPTLSSLDPTLRVFLQEVTRICLPLPHLLALLAAGEGIDPATPPGEGIDVIAFIDVRRSQGRPFSYRYIRALLRALADKSGYRLSIHFQPRGAAEDVLAEPRRWRLWAQGIVLHGKLEDVLEDNLLRFLTRPLDEELADQHRAHAWLATARQQLHIADSGQTDAIHDISQVLHSYDADGLDQAAYNIARAVVTLDGQEIEDRRRLLERALRKLRVKAPQLQQLCDPATPSARVFKRQDVRRELDHFLAAAESFLADVNASEGRI